MRDRHFPRVCRSCGVPMARQEDNCWHCESVWEDQSAGQDRRLAAVGDAPAVLQARFAQPPFAGEGGSWAALAGEGGSWAAQDSERVIPAVPALR